jgi:hypothetical protein
MEPKSRKVYSSTVNEIMLKASKFMPGNPVNVSYWASTKDFFPALKEFSADSLRAHWILLQSKKPKPKPNKIVLPVKSNQKPSENKKRESNKDPRLSEYFNEPIPENDVKEEETTYFESDQETEKKRLFKEKPAQNCEKIKKNTLAEMDSQEIIDCFYDLVDICSFCAGRRLPEKVVLQTLIENDGVVKTTVDSFKRFN